jgi:gamma-glutamyltranspeptidase/glutathione hydrolase
MGKSTFSRSALGAVAAAHPAAVDAGIEAFRRGGNAVDAAVAAQAALCVAMPEACGLGGDSLCLIASPDGRVEAVNGAGAAPLESPPAANTPGGAVTVPGIVHAWGVLGGSAGRLGLAADLSRPALLASEGIAVGRSTAAAVASQEDRLIAGGAGSWELLHRSAGELWIQDVLAELLGSIADEGPDPFYRGRIAAAIAAAVQAHGGTLSERDLAEHVTPQPEPIGVAWDGGRLFVQPPMSQGILLAMAAAWFEARDKPEAFDLQHLGVEAVSAAFEHRHRVRHGAALLEVELDVDPHTASHRSGPRGYLHTAGVATAGADGTVVSSLVSVFDDFGSGVFVPEGGFVLNNRAEGFGEAPNDPRPGGRPVHTLTPAIVLDAKGHPMALATPGADGQVQTLLQMLLAMRYDRIDIASAIDRPRWRSEDGRLLIEDGHPAVQGLRDRGHLVDTIEFGDQRLGAVVAAGVDEDGPWACGDHRREVATSGV